MIEICNLRFEKPCYPYDVKVCRTMSILGNPFVMDDQQDRDKVCDMYDVWFNENLKKLRPELIFLYNMWKRHCRLRLFCWCAPKRCHAETVRKWILNYKGD